MVASTPAEAARKLFEERNLSKKINFKVLDNLLENLTESIPNTPTSWRDYDPTSISGSGIARSGTPVSNNRWSDEEDYDWNHQSLKLNNKDSLNSTATTPGLTEDGDDYVEYDNNDIYGSESYEKYENDDHNYDNEYEGDPYDESNEDDY